MSSQVMRRHWPLFASILAAVLAACLFGVALSAFPASPAHAGGGATVSLGWEGDTGGWTVDYGPATVSPGGTNGVEGPYTLAVNVQNANGYPAVMSPKLTGVVPGEVMTFYILAPQAIGIQPYASDTSYNYSQSPVINIPANTWTQVQWTIPATMANVWYVGVQFNDTNPPVMNGTYYLDSGQIAPAGGSGGGPSTSALPNSSNFTLAGEDTFQGTSVDTSKWNVYAGAKGNDTWTPADCQEGGGYLTLVGDASSGTCGMSWKTYQEYGAWQVTAKFDPNRDSHFDSTFLLWPQTSADSPNTETDYVELTDPTAQTFHSYVHCTSCSGGQLSYAHTVDMTQWHTYTYEWTPAGLSFFVDGVQYATEGTNIPAELMHGTLQMDWTTTPGAATKTTEEVADYQVYNYSGSTPSATPTPTPTPTQTQTGSAKNIMVIPLENTSYSGIIGNSSAPYFNSLANSYKLAMQSYGVGHWSLDNYLALMSGQWYSWAASDCGVGSSCIAPSTDSTLVNQLDTAKIPWKAYFQNMPAACDATNTGTGGYAERHNPFLYFPSISSSECQSNDVPDTNMISDLNSSSAPNFVFYAPNLCNDGHDCSLATADSWLSTEIPAIQATNWYKNGGTIVITADEGNASGQGQGEYTTGEGNHIATIVVNESDKGAAQYTSYFTHWGTLGGLEAAYGVPCLANACSPSQWGQLPIP